MSCKALRTFDLNELRFSKASISFSSARLNQFATTHFENANNKAGRTAEGKIPAAKLTDTGNRDAPRGTHVVAILTHFRHRTLT